MLLYLAKYSTYQCRVWALIDTADTATRIPSFTPPAYLVTESYGGKVLDSFSIKLLNRLTYLPETQAPGLFQQALAINVAVFTVSSTQARVFEPFSNLELSIRKNSTLRSAVPAHDDANGNLVMTVWQDTKPVVVLSTNCDPTVQTEVKRKQKDGSQTTVQCPLSVQVYNKYMGGVDTADQYRGCYTVRAKSLCVLGFI